MSSYRKNKWGAVFSYVNMLISVIVGILVTPILIKNLGDSEYGIFIMVSSFSVYLGVVQSGFSDTVIRYSTKFRAKDDPEGTNLFNGLVMSINMVLTVMLLLSGLVLYYYGAA